MIYKNNRPENATELRILAEEIIREKADPSPETFATMTLEEIRQAAYRFKYPSKRMVLPRQRGISRMNEMAER